MNIHGISTIKKQYRQWRLLLLLPGVLLAGCVTTETAETPETTETREVQPKTRVGGAVSLRITIEFPSKLIPAANQLFLNYDRHPEIKHGTRRINREGIAAVYFNVSNLQARAAEERFRAYIRYDELAGSAVLETELGITGIQSILGLPAGLVPQGLETMSSAAIREYYTLILAGIGERFDISVDELLQEVRVTAALQGGGAAPQSEIPVETSSGESGDDVLPLRQNGSKTLRRMTIGKERIVLRGRYRTAEL